VAYELAEAGLDVAAIERGPRRDTELFLLGYAAPAATAKAVRKVREEPHAATARRAP